MGILDRISTLISSNVNAAIDKMTDPAKEIDQLVIDMESQVKKARQEVHQTLATEKRHRQRVEELDKSAHGWQERAERAVHAGDDGLAREALKRKGEVELEKGDAERALRDQEAYADQLTAALKALEARVQEVKMKKETLKAKARAS